MKTKKSFIRKFLSLSTFFTLLILFVVIVSVCNVIIIAVSNPHINDEVKEMPVVKTGVVLGTSRLLMSGQPNPYFHYRISAAAELYHSGKVEYIIASGDNRTRYYNEPEQMRRELIKYDVPDSIIYLDYAGLRTLDSMIRSQKVFGQDSIIVISQKFHNQRAVFIARAHGINAWGYNATDLDARQGVRTNVREVFARVKVFLDLITRKGPRHLGDEVEVGIIQER